MSEITTQRCIRCKKIEYKLKNEGLSREELEDILTEPVPQKIINKSYDSIPHLSGSRLGEGDSHIDLKQEQLMTVELPKTDCHLIIEEKLDGSNCAVIRYKGDIVAVGRSGYRCSESNFEQHRMFARYVENRKEQFEKLLPNEGDKVVGEWLAMAHGTIYPNIEVPYIVFDLWVNGLRMNWVERKALFSAHGFKQPARIFNGDKPIDIQMAMTALFMYNPIAEGIVYRLEVFNKKTHRYIPYLIAKVVRNDKEDGKFLKGDPIWMWHEVD